MYGRTSIFVENFHVNNLWVVLEIFHVGLIFMGQGYPRKLFNLKHFPIYSITLNLWCHLDVASYMGILYLNLTKSWSTN